MDDACRPVPREGTPGPAPWSWAELGERFFVVAETNGEQRLDCLGRLPVDCAPLFPERRWMSFYECRARGR
jgi:hypothetical protein